ncbi:MAG: prolyl oligopeptidase family serine peptidase [Chloroflexota bacterium]
MTDKRKLQVEDLLAFKLAGDSRISPDGGSVAYVLQEIDKEKNDYNTSIWLAREGQAPFRFTGGNKDNSPRWSPDGKYLAFVSKRSGSNQIWILPLAGGEARQLTRVKGGAGNPVWSPDSKYIAFTSSLTAKGIEPEGEDPEEKDLYKKYNKDVKIIDRILWKMDGVGYYTDKRSQVCVIAVDGGEPKQLTSGQWNHLDPSWTPDSENVIFTANRTEDSDYQPWFVDIWSVPRTGGEITRLSPGDGKLAANEPSVSPDGRKIAFIGVDPEEHGYGINHLYLLENGQVRQLTTIDREFGNSGAVDMPAPAGGRLTWSPDGRFIFGLMSDSGTVQLVRVDATSGAVTPVTGGDRMIHSYSLSSDCRRAAIAYGTGCSPADVYLAKLDEPKPVARLANSHQILAGGGVEEVRLTSHNADLLAGIDYPVPERFVFTAGEGHAGIDGWILRPAGFEPGKKYPTILEIHGGPASMYGSGMFFEFQWLAANGYAVVFCNPRGSLGYGRDFVHCIMADWGNLDYMDCMAAVETAVKRFDFVDSDRLGVAGGSYGGFMVNWIVTHTNRFKAAVTMRPVVNRWSSMGTSDTAYNRVGQFGTENWWEEKNMAPYLKQSPLIHVSNCETPLLIDSEEGDLRCPPEQAEQLYTALKFQRKTVKMVRYPNEFHGMSRTGKPWHRIHRLNMISDWFKQYLG